jgi:hypothetical protein
MLHPPRFLHSGMETAIGPVGGIPLRAARGAEDPEPAVDRAWGNDLKLLLIRGNTGAPRRPDCGGGR